MTIRFLVNFVLIAIPIGTTLAVLFGIQGHRDATGQAPLFAPEPPDFPGDGGNGGGGGGGPRPKQGLGHQMLCQKSFGFAPTSKGQKYIRMCRLLFSTTDRRGSSILNTARSLPRGSTARKDRSLRERELRPDGLNPNQWNWNVGDAGGLCMNVTYFNNGTYPTEFTAPEFQITWQYPQGPATDPVHAFPNIQLDGDSLPAPINTISKMDLDLEWTYATGNGTTEASTAAALTAANLNTNVAIDMFMDADKKKSQSPSDATYEVMVWFAAFGPATQPLGLPKGVLATKTINGATFSLYHDQNQNKQEVLTWYSTQPILEFSGDITPLINAIFTLQLPGLPSETDYLGYWSFGSEAFSCPEVVTFNVPRFSLDIETA
ncbi:Endoglucanase-1 [Escovopsis weberi]|uniref:Endoglucanase-1 n=1 Tax=Escovopsis weberi TaxID=150374 RepID=A0A0N0RSW3_ESCWE|nr:Endoglucanase-1 [Escovopsis weberi]